MPPKARIVRKPSATGSSNSPKPSPPTAPPLTTMTPSATKPTLSTPGTVANPKEGTMLPPPDPSPPKAILEPELNALASCLRNAAVKTSQVHTFFADTKRLGINHFVTRPPHTLTDALCREIEKYDQICDLMEAQLSRAIAVLQRDLDLAKAQEQAEREAEALRNRPPPEPEIVPESNNPSSGSPLPMDVSGAPGTQKSAQPGAGSFPGARRQSTISLSSLSRPQFPHKLDLSSDALRNPSEFTQGLGGGLPSPVPLAPKSGRSTATTEFPPDFMAALTSDMANRQVEIDLTMLPEDARSAAHVRLDPPLGSSADRPIELDLEGVDIDMADMNVSLFGDEPTNDISTANPFDNTTTTAGDHPPSPGSLLAAFNGHAQGITQAGVTELPFDMPVDEMNNIEFHLDSMMNTSDMGMIDIDMNALLSMGSEAGTQAEGQSGAGDS
ncbi:hypothetical protein BC826DRAFT_1103791 [Russula brevipes]|nr:hypothetical protein BC826DRAFT_1103791 [Russula brevipes]